ncbi:class I SAM-dependent methyltransferase [Ureibacillus aquaedulcis]|uniref:Class I SAM-dependent methyltransferase n=1 Tax=Ureibacillus aquaedulcis TaxID=3058421 RepID=A0ABT8GRX2_9BACL|nr:class I SAM-dependent methyltransferase [Ureibacillus sp. BA0131]MDN4494119.1 class I SAM-dependent methyltransferase [Ureibacillus sp. BA0131]
MKQNIYDNNTFFEKYQEIRARENNYNNLLEQPNFSALIPTLKNKVIMDIGCGMGDFAAYCISQGAKQVTGIDISSNMITNAKKRHIHEGLTFEQAAIEDMTVPNGTIDLVSSSLVFHYIADFQLLIKKISTVLCEDGILLFSLEHPIVTANKGKENWITNEEGDLLHFAVDNYQNEGLRTQNWLVDHVMMYHRTMSTILNTLIENGLQIEKILEPIPTKEAVCNLPSLHKEFRRPSFLIIRAKKCKN